MKFRINTASSLLTCEVEASSLEQAARTYAMEMFGGNTSVVRLHRDSGEDGWFTLWGGSPRARVGPAIRVTEVQTTEQERRDIIVGASVALLHDLPETLRESLLRSFSWWHRDADPTAMYRSADGVQETLEQGRVRILQRLTEDLPDLLSNLKQAVTGGWADEFVERVYRELRTLD